MKFEDNIISDYCKDIDLKTRIKVKSEITFINLIHELGYREDKMWTSEEEEILNKLLKLASEFTNDVIDEIGQWEKDGKPELNQFNENLSKK